MAPVLPQVVIPIARRVLREMVGHLIVDATDAKLGPAIAKIRKDGIKLNVNLLGEAVLGEHEASRRLEGTHTLLARPDVDYVSIKVSSTVAPHSAWAFDEAVEHVVEKLTPLFTRAASFAAGGQKAKFINLDMEEYKDLDMTIAVFTRILDKPEFKNLEAGIVLQAYLPDALAAMIRLQDWAAARRADGGAAIKVRVVKGANLPMEQVEASLHDWPLATWGTKQDSDTNYKRVINYALHPDRIRNVRIGVAGHNLFDIAFAWLLAKQRGVADRGIEFEMLLGMAQGQAEAVKKDVGSLLLYTPGGAPGRVRRRDRLPDPPPRRGRQPGQLHVRRVRAQRERSAVRAREAALPRLAGQARRRGPAAEPPAEPQPSRPRRCRTTRSRTPRTPTRRCPPTATGAAPSWAASRPPRWATPPSRPPRSTTRRPSNAVIETAVEKGKAWGALSGAERAEILHRAGDVLEARRADLLEVMASETGKTIDQGDPEVSEAVDFAHYYAESARKLDDVDGATFVPAEAHRRDPAVELPGRHPGRLHARGARRRLRRRHQARQAGPPQRRRHDRGALGGRRPARRAHHGPAGRAGARPAAHLPPGRGPRDPHRRLRDRRAVPLLPQGPAAAGRDQRQERHHRHPERRPGPRRQGRRVLRVRPRRPEVLRRLAGDPGRLRGQVASASTTS